jgi:hypothetical protein
MKIRLQIALLHKSKGDFQEADVDFEKRERLLKQSLLLDQIKLQSMKIHESRPRRGSIISKHTSTRNLDNSKSPATASSRKKNKVLQRSFV